MKTRTLIIGLFLLFFLNACKKEQTQIITPPKQDDNVAWMSQLMLDFPNKEIKIGQLGLPGSHDAGMYVLKHCSFGANDCNTKTQVLNMTQQLESGARIFDIRPTIIGQTYFVYHRNECGGLGCNGDSLKSILRMTKYFVEKYPEVVILDFSHFCKVEATDPNFIHFLQEELGNNIYKETTREELFYDWTLNQVLGEHPTKGKVILMFDEGTMDNTEQNRQEGLFSTEIMRLTAGWTNKDNYPELKSSQLAQFEQFQGGHPYFFQFSWEVTLNTTQSITCALDKRNSILAQAEVSNPDFQLVIDSLIQNQAIRPGKIPNIFWMDHVDKWMLPIASKISRIGIQ